MRRTGLAVAAVFLVVGCATAPQTPDDEMVFGRVDCRLLADHPDLLPEFEQAKAICSNRGEAQGEAASASMGTGGGLGGSVVRAMTSVSVRDKTAISCMAERGYLLKKRSEYMAWCATMYPPKPTPAVAEVKPKKPKSAPKPNPEAPAPAQ